MKLRVSGIAGPSLPSSFHEAAAAVVEAAAAEGGAPGARARVVSRLRCQQEASWPYYYYVTVSLVVPARRRSAQWHLMEFIRIPHLTGDLCPNLLNK